MDKGILILNICFALFVKTGIEEICAKIERLDGTMQQVHMELYKIRVGEECPKD